MAYQPPPEAKTLDLRSAHLKIERAKKHIADLDEERIRFLGKNQYLGVPKFHAESNSTYFLIESLPTIPDEIPLILGDAAHALRVALDYLACELVRSTGGDPKGVYFPIFDSVEKYESESDGKTKGMPKVAKDLIDSMRPYRGGNDGLWVLHRLDIMDKHRLLLTASVKVGSWSVTMDQTARNYGFAFLQAMKAGDIIGSVEGNHEADKQMSITADVTFGEPEVVVGRPMVETLSELAKYVQLIVSYFG